MCGITGFAGFNDSQLLKKMSSLLEHRGPDEEGYFEDKQVSLASRRLSIVDLKGGKQPVHNEDQSVFLVFNGEIYNFEQLTRELVQKGHRFYTESDTEAIVHAYEEFGEEMFDRFNGQFAIALWDTKQKKLLLARDHFGEKPLYYCILGEKIVFASEPKSILCCEETKREANPGALKKTIALGYVPGKETVFQGIFKLEPGEMLSWQEGKASTKKFFDIAISSQHYSEEIAVEKLLLLLEESVKNRIPKEVKAGFFISGGIDSGAIAALAKKHMLEEQFTYSVWFPEGESELNYARLVAEHVSSNHKEISVGTKDCSESIILSTWHQDEPVSDAASIPVLLMAKEARKKVKVIMTGDAGDELFAGYERYKVAMQLEKLMSGLPEQAKQVFKWMEPKVNSIPKVRAAVSMMANSGEMEKTYPQTHYFASEKHLQELFGEKTEFFDKEFLEKTFSKKSNSSQLEKMLCFDMKTQLAEGFLLKTDRNTMASSVEGRMPFLDLQLARFAFSLEDSLKIRGATEKYILKKALAKTLPKEITSRKKHPFNAPQKIWTKNLLAEKAGELAETEFAKKYLRKEKLESLLRNKSNPHPVLWRIFTTAVWHEIFIENNPAKQGTARIIKKF